MDHYDTLGVVSSASADDIKKAYRKLAMRFHPDRNQGSKIAEARFKEVSAAYEVLGDPVERRAYDRRFQRANSASAPSSNAYDDPRRRANDYQQQRAAEEIRRAREAYEKRRAEALRAHEAALLLELLRRKAAELEARQKAREARRIARRSAAVTTLNYAAWGLAIIVGLGTGSILQALVTFVLSILVGVILAGLMLSFLEAAD